MRDFKNHMQTHGAEISDSLRLLMYKILPLLRILQSIPEYNKRRLTDNTRNGPFAKSTEITTI